MTWGGIPLDKLSAPTIVVLVVLMILFRLLIPRATYKEKCKESDYWREAYYAEREARTKSDAQTTELLEIGKTTQNVLIAVFGTTGLIDRAGGEQWDSSKSFRGSVERRTPKRQGKLSKMLDQISLM